MEIVDNVFSDYDRAKEVKEFDETKAGVKGLVDSGVVKIPRFFIHPPEKLPGPLSNNIASDHISQLVPVIDLKGFGSEQRSEIVNEIRAAAETWGTFKMVNHGVPSATMAELLEGIRQFHEQPKEVKMKWYSRDTSLLVRYISNGSLFHASRPAHWRDTLACAFPNEQLDKDELPQVCRQAITEFMKCMVKLKDILSELLSEALGLSSDYLERLDCLSSESMVCNYYPICPEPELTLGAPKHSDPYILTILLQDHIGGLQVLHQNQWVDVPPVDGALIANIGDFMQLITNDRFKSVEHRVLAGKIGARVSAACFFMPSTDNKLKAYGPIKELLSENNPPIYKETHLTEYRAQYRSTGLDVTTLSLFKQP
ncbi:1-aminocyclopropane-1-carboxylate oxidase homolog 1 [Quercus suber]